MHRRHSSVLAAILAATCLLGGCENNARQASEAPPPTDGARDGMDFTTAADALRITETLHGSGANAEALKVIAAAYRRFPQDTAIVSAYGRLAAVNGQDELAERLLREALAASPNDWRALSAQGVLDSRVGKVADARKALAHARSASGENAVTLNNLAVSLILDARPDEAEQMLRQALASPLLKPQYQRRLRFNLALALAIQGRTGEAAAIAGTPLPANLKNADPATLRRLMGLGAQPATPKSQPDAVRSWRPSHEPTGS